MKYVGISRYKAIMESHYENYILNDTKITYDKLMRYKGIIMRNKGGIMRYKVRIMEIMLKL